MLFEETPPAGTASLFHLHRDSDEVAWVLAEHRPTSADEHDKLFQRHRWKVVGPNPL